MIYASLKKNLPVILILFKVLLSSEADSVQNAISTKIAPYYSEAQSGLLPMGYIKKGDTCAVSGVYVDTTGIPWFSFKIKSKKVWSPAKYWLYISEADPEAFADGRREEADKKRRLRILRKHRDWPRRIIRAVRLGRICLEMTSEQLIAAWDEPIQRSSAFTIGLGKHSVWIFKGRKGEVPAVILKNNKIIGWTIK